MSKEADVESDSPISRHDLSDVTDDINIDEPFCGPSFYEIINDKPEHNKEIVSFRSKNWEGRVEMHTTPHETFPSPVHSDTLSFDRPVYETPSLSTSRMADLVRQPSRWEAELPRAIGLNTGGCKASLVVPLPPTFKPPNSSSCLEGNEMTLLSEACAAVSTPKFFSNIFDERPIQPASRYDIGKKTTSPSRQVFCLLTKDRLIIKAKK